MRTTVLVEALTVCMQTWPADRSPYATRRRRRVSCARAVAVLVAHVSIAERTGREARTGYGRGPCGSCDSRTRNRGSGVCRRGTGRGRWERRGGRGNRGRGNGKPPIPATIPEKEDCSAANDRRASLDLHAACHNTADLTTAITTRGISYVRITTSASGIRSTKVWSRAAGDINT
jgi:hypothetical protein